MKLYETLSTKFGPANAESFANFIDEKINEKESSMEAKLLSKIDQLGRDIKAEIAELKIDLYKWTVVTFLSALAILVAAMAFFKN